jgi:hypothetical protein
MPSADHYRYSAQECRRHAEEAKDTHEREALLRMAAQWDRLADHKTRKEAEARKAAPVGGSSISAPFDRGELSRMIQVSNFDQTVTGKVGKVPLG